MPSVASEAPPHALNSSSPHPRRHAPAPERTQSSPFESLLDDSGQTTAERPAQAASGDDTPRTARPESPNPPTKSDGSKPAKTAKIGSKVRSADADKPVKPETKTETPDDQFQIPVDGQAVAKVVKQVITPGDEKAIDGKPADDKPADDKPVDDKPVDAKPADATPVDVTPADIIPLDVILVDVAPASVIPTDVKPADVPAPENLGAVISDLARSHTNPVTAGVAGLVLAPTSPKPALQAVDHAAPVAPIADTAQQTAQVASTPDVPGKQAPEENPVDPAELQTGPEIPTKDKKPVVKVAPAIQENGKTQLVAEDANRQVDENGDSLTDSQANIQPDEQIHQQIEKLAGNPADKQSETQQAAHPRGDALVNAHRGAPTDAPGPINADTQIAVPKTGADFVQPLTLTAPSHAGTHAATSQPAVPPPQLVPQAAVPLAGVALEIAGKALAGKNRFEIRLDPPELGRIEVRLDVDRDGNVTSRLVADRADTLDLLRRDAAGLERALQDAGLKTTDNGLQFSLRDQSTGQEQRQNGLDVAQLAVHDETLANNDAIARNYYRRIGPSGGLDIRV